MYNSIEMNVQFYEKWREKNKRFISFNSHMGTFV